MPYLDRNIDPVLRAWAEGAARKPLVVRGARQVGKTAAIRHLAKTFDLFIELNLERAEDRQLVDACQSPSELLDVLLLRENLTQFPARTLLFLDEIQESPEAVRWLRFFYEDHPDLAVVAAGSLMEVRLQERGFSFPVGRVTFRYVHPLTYSEFLGATDRGALAARLRSAAVSGRAVARPIHDEAMDRLRDYLLVGGMPAAVTTWAETSNPSAVRQLHADLMQAFAEDLQKYRGVGDASYLEAAFRALPQHYGRRYKYENFAPGYRSALMKTALGKLEDAMLIRQALPTSTFDPPLRARPRSAPKLIPLDVGLALSTLQVPFLDIRHHAIDALRDGTVAEMFVGQQLLAAQGSQRQDLHFWVAESARANAEVDFLHPVAGRAIPIEVKAGATGSLRSLHQFLSRGGGRAGVRIHAGEMADETLTVGQPQLEYRLLSLPLYLADLVGEGVLPDLA